jgi:hypothetical protein
MVNLLPLHIRMFVFQSCDPVWIRTKKAPRQSSVGALILRRAGIMAKENAPTGQPGRVSSG